MKKWFLLIPLVVLISGCANTRTHWSHHSNSQQNTYRDIADCEVSANRGSSYSYQGDDEVLHVINEWQSIDRRTSIFNNCMAGKGYYKVTEQTKSSYQRKVERLQREMQNLRKSKSSTSHKNIKYKYGKEECINLDGAELMNPPERCIIRYEEWN